MIGKFVFFGILISAPLAITGLKCYQDTGTQKAQRALNATLCPQQHVCAIGNYVGDEVGPTVRYCYESDENTWDGCITQESKTLCFCNTDG